VDQLAWAFALVAAHGFGVRGPVTAVEAAAAGSVQDALHSRRGETGLMRDVISTPTVTPAQLQHLLTQSGLGPHG
jgi:hypothetical protein